jgi:dihydrolipoamide dehydrogenase
MAYDLLVVGSGPGGYVAAIRASQLNMKVGIIEKESLGGICLNWGCIPTKTLLKSAQVYDYVKHADDYGINVGEASINFENMIQRSRNAANGMSKGVNFLMKKNKIDVIEGHGRLTSDKKVEVEQSDGNKTTHEAANVLIATGGRANELPHIPIDGEKVIEYRKAMTLEKQPKSMVIIGGGAIGSEFAYMYNSIGTDVTLVEYMDQILPVEDQEVSKALRKSYKKQGITVKTGTNVKAVDTSGDGCRVTMESQKGEETLDCDIVLSSVGVAPNVEDIGLENLDIQQDKNGKIQVDTYYQTNVSNVFAIGDVIPGPALAHLGSAEGIFCAEYLAGLNPEPLDYNNIPSCTYCSPEVSSVGYTEAQAKEAGYEVKVGNFPYTASGKANSSGHTEGMVKVIFDAKYGEWLGAHMMGDHVTEMISEVVSARKLETTGHEIIKSVHPHPTMSEAVMEATAAAYDEVIHI